jgi:hypothetical protein
MAMPKEDTMVTWRTSLIPVLTLALVALGATGCIDGDDSGVPGAPPVGQIGGFVTAEPSDEYQSGGGGGYVDAGASADAGAAPSADSGSEPPGGRDAKVEEAEIYRVHGDKLFYLNTYRGLLIFDIKDERAPKLLSRLPLYGYPIEMYFKDDSAYVLIKDALYLTQTPGKPARFHRHNVSQLITVDFKDATKPTVLQRHDIEGLLREGLSRKVDDTIYVVSEKPSWYYNGWGGYGGQSGDESAWVYSYDVRDTNKVKSVDKLQLFAGGGHSDWNKGGGSQRSFRGVAISATSNALMVTERWQVYDYQNSGCSSSWYTESTVRIVDISDYSGKIREHTAFTRRGDLTDQFKQTYIYDAKANTGLYLGIFSRNEWGGCQRVVKNELVSIDVTDGKNPKELSTLTFGKPNETVRGSVFDVERKVAFAITARAMDPLYALSFADPKALKIESEIDGLSGDMSVFTFIGDKKFLLAVGRDTSNDCQGFGTGWSSTKMAVSVIDVSHLDAIRLVQRRCVAVDGGKWQSSAISGNQDQAHKMLGLYSDEKINLIAVPVSYYEERKLSESPWDWWYMRRAAVGMMSWDLTKYDPLLPPAQQQVLKNQATVLHPNDEVKRTIFLRRDQGSTLKRLMLTLSDTHLAINDVTKPDQPQLRSTVEIAPYIAGVYRVGKHVVEHVRHGGDGYWYYNDRRPSTFRVKLPATDGSLDNAKQLASLTVGGVQTVLQQDNRLLLLRRKDGRDPITGNYRSEADLLVLDLADPTKPKLAGRLVLPGYVQGYYSGCGMYDHYYYSWGYSRRSFAQTKDGLVLLTRHYEWKQGESKRWVTLAAIDLRDANNPKISYGPKKIEGWDWVGGVTRDGADDKRVLLTVRQDVGDSAKDGLQWKLYRYFALPARLDGGKLSWSAPLSIPGQLVGSYVDGSQPMVLTQDNSYTLRPIEDREWCGSASCHYTSSPRLHLLEAHGSQAKLKASKALPEWRMSSSLIDDRKLALLARRPYDWNQNNDWKPRLLLFDLSKRSFDGGEALAFDTYGVKLLAAHANRLMVHLSGDGVLTLDTTDVKAVRGVRFTRTLGWMHNVAFGQDRAWIASGNFGTQVIQLDKVPTGTQL